MKDKRKSMKKGGGSNSKKSKPVVETVEVPVLPLRGRAPKEDRGEIVLSNGLYARQWEWIQREAANKVPKVDAAWMQRFMVDIVIDAIEASRADIRKLVTLQDDVNFEVLVNQSKPKLNKE